MTTPAHDRRPPRGRYRQLARLRALAEQERIIAAVVARCHGEDRDWWAAALARVRAAIAAEERGDAPAERAG